MKKAKVIEIFGGVKALAEVMGITIYAIYMWPDELDQKRIDQVTGAAYRVGIPLETLKSE